MKIRNWESPERLFETLNKTGQYVVLRNWEAYFDDLFLPGHGDIDLLCSKRDRKKILRAAGAVRRSNIFNQWNYWVFIDDRMVKFDLRVEGDGYYDVKWERDMLSSRRYDDRGFYCLDQRQYFYSLIYHAAYQKREFATDYIERLSEMTACPGDANGLKEELEKYMERMGYKYSYVFNPSVYLNLEGIAEERIERKASEMINMCMRKTVRKGRKFLGGGTYIPDSVEEALKAALDFWMKDYGYCYTVCFDTGVQLNFSSIEKEKVYMSGKVVLYRFIKRKAKKMIRR